MVSTQPASTGAGVKGSRVWSVCILVHTDIEDVRWGVIGKNRKIYMLKTHTAVPGTVDKGLIHVSNW